MSCIICPRTNKYCLDPDCGLTTGICNPSKVAILKESVDMKDIRVTQSEQEPDPLDKFMDEEIAYLKSCNPVDKWGRMENSFAAGMLHAYERIKAEREYISHRKQQNHENI